MHALIRSLLNQTFLQTTALEVNIPSAPELGTVAQGQVLDPLESQARFGALVDIISTFDTPENNVEGFRNLMHLMTEVQGKYKVTKDRLEVLKNTQHLGLPGHGAEEKSATEELSALGALKKAFDTARYKKEGAGISGYISRLGSGESWGDWMSTRTNLGKLAAIASDYSHSEISQKNLLKRLKRDRVDVPRACAEATAVLHELDTIMVMPEAAPKSNPNGQKKGEAQQLGTSRNTSDFLTTFGGLNLNCYYGSDIQVTQDGGFVLTGYTYNGTSGNSDVLVAKLNKTGNILWARVLDRSSGDKGNSIQTTADGGVIVAGSTRNSTSGDTETLLIKMNETGGVLWAKTLGRSYYGGQSLQKTSDGGFILTGFARNNTQVIKLDASGTVVWVKTLSVDKKYKYTSVGFGSTQETQDGGFVLAGSAALVGWSSGASVVKLNETGNVSWATMLYIDGESVLGSGFYSVHETQDGGFALAGMASLYNTTRSTTALVAKLASNGTLLWAKVMYVNSSIDNYALSMQETQDKGFVLTGFTGGEVTVQGTLVAKLNAKGSLLWSKVLEGAGDRGYSIQETQDKGFALTGYKGSPYAAHDEVLVAQLNKMGEISNCSAVQPISLVTMDVLSRTEAIEMTFTSDDTSLNISDVSLNVTDILPKSETVCKAPTPTLKATTNPMSMPMKDKKNLPFDNNHSMSMLRGQLARRLESHLTTSIKGGLLNARPSGLLAGETLKPKRSGVTADAGDSKALPADVTQMLL